MDIPFALSKIIPIPMRSEYEVIDNEIVVRNPLGDVAIHDKESHWERASWWQWRNRIFRHKHLELV